MKTETELRELDAWIAGHVMGLIKVNSVYDLKSSGDFCVGGVEQNCWIVDRLPNIKKFHPTTDPADAMLVLEKCAEKTGHGVFIFRYAGDAEWVITNDSYSVRSEGETLPLAICLFAKSIFSK